MQLLLELNKQLEDWIMQNEGNANAGGWDSEREKALSAREKALGEQETALIDKGLSEAFSRAGGKQTAIWDDPNEISSFTAIKSLLKDKLAFTSTGIIIKGESYPNGKAKSLDDKMKEYKSGSLAGFFNTAEPTQQQQQQQQQPAKITYTREQARNGKADMDAIARGEADIK